MATGHNPTCRGLRDGARLSLQYIIICENQIHTREQGHCLGRAASFPTRAAPNKEDTAVGPEVQLSIIMVRTGLLRVPFSWVRGGGWLAWIE